MQKGVFFPDLNELMVIFNDESGVQQTGYVVGVSWDLGAEDENKSSLMISSESRSDVGGPMIDVIRFQVPLHRFSATELCKTLIEKGGFLNLALKSEIEKIEQHYLLHGDFEDYCCG
jgi:hypothetical protein